MVDVFYNANGMPLRSTQVVSAMLWRWHDGSHRLQAPDAEHLMRSRYSAYVLGRTDYLLETWHPQTRPDRLDPGPPDLQWLGLEVRRHEQTDENHAVVEFVARRKQGGRAARLHEVSAFERLGGRWIYVCGVDGRLKQGSR